MNNNVTAWLGQARHPAEDELFALPDAIYFLLKFRPDLPEFSSKTLADRVALYFWWEALAHVVYPDFDWTLRPQDIEHLSQLDDETLISDYGRAIAYWLRNTRESVLDRKQLVLTLSRGVSSDSRDRLVFPRFLEMIVDSRSDLRRAFHMNTISGRLACFAWWQEHGQNEYPKISWSPADTLSDLLRAAPPNDTGELALPRLLHLVREEHHNLRQAFDVSTFTGRLNYLGWWREHSHIVCPGIRWTLSSASQQLPRLDEAGRNYIGLPHARFSDLLRQCEASRRRGAANDQLEDLEASLTWWSGTQKLASPLATITTNILSTRNANELGDGRVAAAQLPEFLVSIWKERGDLRAAFDPTNLAGVASLVNWWQAHGKNEYIALNSVSVIKVDGDDKFIAVAPETPWHELPFGVNIVGFPQGVLGLAEDARMAARALELASIPRVLVNAPMSGPARLDTSVDHLISTDLKYGVSLFCLPPPEMFRLALEGGRSLIERDTYKIGAWPWELPQWPTAFGKLHRFVNEIWAQSKFVQSAFSWQTEAPVYHMPMAVEVPAPVAPVRERFGLPNGKFLFYLMFDGHSWLTRKNPLAGIEAFRKAFGDGATDVSLVVKAMNVQDSDPTWRTVKEWASMDSRIQIISERLSRQDTIDFMASCDAYISLHRSEGFGRIIAEAMLLGQPVVVTNFSGNVDFCDEDTSFLVQGELVPLRAGDYLFYEGQYWCDPDTSIAADQIRTVFEDQKRRDRVSRAGQQRIIQDYSIASVSRAYAQRLSDITGLVEGR
ncbi:glycosyl transferase group 3 [Trinickia symbiotica]|uniref:Glycosyl transferase group 3 n=1 Tax=Trinickia symbiotica TaxID=863227 RepID=A0A2T3XW35_9BURK|nr:glycosyltransferase family 4 protein [Trinickia symbiotica]PTB20707.1 glycosyl transferase group 3 [Trinickia symbiotica]